MLKKSIVINKIEALLFLLLCFMIVPTYLYNFPYFVAVSNIIYYVLFLLCILHIFRYYKNCSVIFWLILLATILQGISTAMMQPELLDTYSKLSLKAITFCYILDYGMRKRPKEFINALVRYFEFIIIINLFTILFFPSGMYQSGSYESNFYMGYHNTHIRWQLPAIALSFIYSLSVYKKVKLRSVLLYVVVFISNIMVSSSTAIIILAVFGLGLLYILLNKRKDVEKGIKLFTPMTAILTLVVGSILVIGSTLFSLKFDLLAKIIDFFGKDISLTGRNYIWVNALEAIQNKLLWGYGYEEANITSMRLVGTVGYGTSPHNFGLEVLYVGGVMLAIAILLIYFILQYKVSKVKNIPATSICGLWLLTVSIMGVTEPQYGTYLKLAWIVTGNILYLYQANGLIVWRNKISIQK